MNFLHIYWPSLVNPLCAFLLAPLLIGVINRVKALFGGRTGPPLWQPYYDLQRLLQKGVVYSRTVSWAFLLGPTVGLAALVLIQLILPLGSHPGFISFGGDFILFVYLLGVARFCTILSALDTGSAFEGMGASREALFSTLAEPALLLGLAAVAHVAHSQVPPTLPNAVTEAVSTEAVPPAFEVSMSHIHALLSYHTWGRHGMVLALVASSFFIVLLCENSRMPVDDPTTHLELTMIHEVMALDHSGPDLAFIEYTSALKHWALGSLLLGMITPVNSGLLVDIPAALMAMFALAVLIGVVESTMARLRMSRVPQFLVGAAAISALALVLEYGYRE